MLACTRISPSPAKQLHSNASADRRLPKSSTAVGRRLSPANQKGPEMSAKGIRGAQPSLHATAAGSELG